MSGVNGGLYSPTDGTATNTVAEAYLTAGNATQFSVSLGSFFETVSPNMLDLSLLPEIVVTIHLAGNSVITSGKGGLLATGPNSFVEPGNSQATFGVNNYSLLVPCYSIDDGMYQKVLAARMSEAGYLTCTFKGYDAFSDTFSVVTRAASAASSLDKLIAVFRKSDYNNTSGAIPIAGTNPEPIHSAGLTFEGRTHHIYHVVQVLHVAVPNDLGGQIALA